MATVQIQGNLVEDPVQRQTGAGDPVVNFTIAATDRVYDRQAGQWKDGETTFLRCVIYRDPARNFAASVRKGTRVVVEGRLKPNDYEKDGVKRYGHVLEVDEAAVSTRFTAWSRVASDEGESRPQGRRAAQGQPDDGRPF